MERAVGLQFRCFSLVELLVVMFIITILASLLMPAIGTIRGKTAEAQCVNNLRILGQAILSYSFDYRGYIPHEDRGTGNKPPFDSCWFDLLPKYMNIDSFTGYAAGACQDDLGRNEKVYNPESDILYTYKMNSRLEDYKGPSRSKPSPPFRRLNSLRSPTETVALFDGRVDKSSYQYRPYGMHTSVYQRHGGGAGMLFFDGHSKVIYNNYNDDGQWKDEGDLIWGPVR